MVKSLGIIPARYGSTRFPGKPLVLIGGVTMIERVYRQAEKSQLDHIVVATDDERIADTISDFGGHVVMTDSNLLTGTDRCREAFIKLNSKADVVVNIQGDEPFIDPNQINKVVKLLQNSAVQIATLISQAVSEEEISNVNRVKVVVSTKGKALYFSRQAIPYNAPASANSWKEKYNHYIHLGLYGYRSQVLLELGHLTQSSLEIAESLEQLRWLENGYEIHTALTKERADAVDTPEDLKVIIKKYFL